MYNKVKNINYKINSTGCFLFSKVYTE